MAFTTFAQILPLVCPLLHMSKFDANPFFGPVRVTGPELSGVTSNCLYVCYIELWKAEKPSPCYNYKVLHIFLRKFNAPLLRYIPFLSFV